MSESEKYCWYCQKPKQKAGFKAISKQSQACADCYIARKKPVKVVYKARNAETLQ